MKLFSETVNKNPEDINSENESKYDQKVPAEEVGKFKEGFVKKIETKAKK